tara:strand:+ start:4053 stop:4316 length:264 start_codon:yes stop_codon:yes gene_type:complete
MKKINNKVKALIWASIFTAPYVLAFLVGAVWAAFNVDKMHELNQLGDAATNNYMLSVLEPWLPILTFIESLSWVAIVYVFVKLWKKK